MDFSARLKNKDTLVLKCYRWKISQTTITTTSTQQQKQQNISKTVNTDGFFFENE